MEHRFTAGSREAGQRLDTWLCQKIPSVSRKQIKTLLDAGHVLVNGRRVVIAGWELEQDDEISVKIPENFERRSSEGEPSAASQPAGERRREGGSTARHGKRVAVSASIDRYLDRKRVARNRPRQESGKGNKSEAPLRLKVYYEDRDLIVIEKPGGILSVPKEGADDKGTLVAHIRAYLRRRYPKARHSFVGPLHRLDAETSGIMVFALSKAGQQLTQQFKNHSIHRSYEAIVLGAVPKENGVIDRPLEKGEFGGGKKVREAEGEEGMRAVTEFRVKERYKDASLLDVTVRTGRTHQIRVHLAAEGFPVLGDALYSEHEKQGHEVVLDEVDRHLGFRRHALHAASIGFRHPTNGKKMHFRSPLPEDMRGLVDALRTG